jgi:hypothetical protein
MKPNLLGLWLAHELARVHAADPDNWPEPYQLEVTRVELAGPKGALYLIITPDTATALKALLPGWPDAPAAPPAESPAPAPPGAA